jgi:hypothetical protein
MMQSTLSGARFTSVLTILIIMTQLNACISVEGSGDPADAIVISQTPDTTSGVTPDVSTPVVTPVVTPAASLSWVAPVEREDGTPISMAEIAGYRVYYGTSQGDYTDQVEVADSTTMQVTLSDMATGTYYFVVTAVDMDGRESNFSQEISQSI